MRLKSNVYGVLVPHAPNLLEDEVAQKNSPVINVLQDTGKRLKDWGVEVVVAATTHWQTDKFLVDDAAFQTLTDYHGFRREIKYDVSGHPDFIADERHCAG